MLPITFDEQQYGAAARRGRVLPSLPCPLPGNSHAQVGTDGCKDFQRWARVHPNSLTASACRLCQYHGKEAKA